MSGVGRHRPEKPGVVRAGGEWSEADYTVRRFRPEGLGLDGKGPLRPPLPKRNVSAESCQKRLARGIVTRRAETGVLRLRGNRLAR